MSKLSDAVKAQNDALQKNKSVALATKQFGQAVTDWVVATDPVAPPAPSTRWVGWGANIANASQLVTPGGRRGELQRIKDVGGTFPRIDGDHAEADLCRQLGFKQWVVILGAGKTFPSAIATFAYLDGYPEAWVEPTNEINLGNYGWTPESHAAAQIAWYRAVKATFPAATLLLASIGNSESSSGTGGLTPIQWCTRLAAAGCRPGNGFDIANYHVYEGNNPNWYLWRDDATGHSVQSVFGHPEYIISEFGSRSDTNGEDAQAAMVEFQMGWIRQDPKCVGAQIYAIGDDAEGGSRTSAPYGWGLYRLDGQPKKAAAVFKAEAAA